MKRIALLLIGLVLGLGIGVGWFYKTLPSWSLEVLSLPEARTIRLEKGTRLTDFAKQLQDEGLIDQAQRFRYWVKFYGDYGKFQAGQYRFESAVSPRQIVEAIEAGRVWQAIELQFVIPEGFTLKQTIDRLEAHKLGNRAQLEAAASDPSLLQKYKITGKNMEGYFFPATYSFSKMPTVEAVYEKMIQTFFAQLPPGIEADLARVKLTLHQAVVFASLIERETQLDEERSMVSVVIWNSLKDGE
ncbi:MAG: endolytic transglycosylase MltG, partial [Proteobacteria bacterium]|nr:endolytic transglycosylase MltG [Pseudomonadota bacterium]